MRMTRESQAALRKDATKLANRLQQAGDLIDPDAAVSVTAAVGNISAEARGDIQIETAATAPNAPSMDDQTDTAELRIQVSEARTDTKFERLIGEFRTDSAVTRAALSTLSASVVELKADGKSTRITVIGTGIAAVAIVIAVMAYGQTWFGIGVSTRDVVKSAVTDYIQQHPTPKP